MAVLKLNPQSAVLFFGQHQKQINLLVVIVLAVYLLAFLADIMWRIIPEPEGSAQSVAQLNTNSQATQSKGAAQLDIRALRALNLFGNPVVKSAPVEESVVTDAPETRLNLVLAGVVANSTESLGTAIIEHQGKQNTYGIGENIDGTNASLNKVYVDRVIIKNGVRTETLMLEGIDYEEANRERDRAQQQFSATKGPITVPEPPELSEDAIEATRQLRESPDSFVDFISVTPHRVNNEMVGYQIKPGKNPALFEAAGLKNGDVVTQINGFDVTDPQQSMEALAELRRADTIELNVTREGELITLFLELPEA